MIHYDSDPKPDTTLRSRFILAGIKSRNREALLLSMPEHQIDRLPLAVWREWRGLKAILAGEAGQAAQRQAEASERLGTAQRQGR